MIFVTTAGSACPLRKNVSPVLFCRGLFNELGERGRNRTATRAGLRLRDGRGGENAADEQADART